MRARSLFAALLAATILTIPMPFAATPDEQQLQIAETPDSFRLSVPVSRLVMTLPKGKLAVVKESNGGGAASPRYFHFEDSTRGIIVSGWFESADSYKGIEQFWKGETDAWKRNPFPSRKTRRS